MTTIVRSPYFLDHETQVKRSHDVSVIAVQLELADSGWPGEGSKADVARVRAARRLAWGRWMADVGEFTDE